MPKQKAVIEIENQKVSMERTSTLSQLLEEALFEQAKSEQQDKLMSSVHAGKIADCSRRTAFALFNLHEDFADPVGMIHMRMGIQWHEFLQDLLMKSGKAKGVETKFPKLGEIAGMMDIMIDDGENSVPVEIKPMTKDKFQSAKEPDKNHISQLQLYMHWTKAPYGYILYYCKNITHYRFDTHNRLPFLEFKVDYNKQLVESFIRKADSIMKTVQSGDLPLIPEEFGPDFCKYCPYYPVKCIDGMSYVNKRIEELQKQRRPTGAAQRKKEN